MFHCFCVRPSRLFELSSLVASIQEQSKRKILMIPVKVCKVDQLLLSIEELEHTTLTSCIDIHPVIS